MKIKKSSVFGVFGALYLCFFLIFTFLAFQPQTVEANTNLVLEIPKIGLTSPIRALEITDENTLISPERIAGVYHANQNHDFIIGHSSTIFQNLDKLAIGDTFRFGDQTYQIKTRKIQPKSEIDMSKLLTKKSTPTITLMTCHGEKISGHDYTERLILTAELI